MPVKTLLRILRFGLELGLPLRTIVVLVSIKLFVIVFEALTLASLIPVIEFLSRGATGTAFSSAMDWVNAGFGYFNLQPSLASLAVISLGLVIARQVVQFLYNVSLAKARETFLADIRSGLLKVFLSSRLEEQERSLKGEIINGLTIEAERAASGALEIVAFIGNVVLLAFYIIGLAVLSPEMILAVSGILLACLLPMRFILRRTVANNRELVGDNANAMTMLVNRLRSARLVRLAGMETTESSDFAKLIGRIGERRTENARLAARIPLIVEPLSVGAALLCVVLAVDVFHTGIATVLVFLTALLRTLPVFRECLSLVQKFASMEHSLATVRHQFEHLHRAREPSTSGFPLPPLQVGIVLENASYRYPDAAAPALQNVSLTIPARRITAIVGPSGAGKSTLIDMLPCLRLPSQGRILIDGHDIRSIDTQSLRQAIAYAQQSPGRLNHSIRELLSYGNAGHDDDRLWEILAIVGLEKEVRSRPRGLDSMLSDEATGFSGGQMQRLEIARTLAQSPQIVILDEPTSNLDEQSELGVIECIRRLRDDLGLTVIIVTHRLGVLDICDQVVRLESGQISAVEASQAAVHTLPSIVQTARH
jgi:ABC-type multidrug transport system fused ATPase/permease subunit